MCQSAPGRGDSCALAAVQPFLHPFQVLSPSTIQVMSRLGVVANVQPQFVYSDAPIALQRLGHDRLMEPGGGGYAWATLRAAGVVVCGGSDAPVEEPRPLMGMYHAITRKGPDGDCLRPEVYEPLIHSLPFSSPAFPSDPGCHSVPPEWPTLFCHKGCQKESRDESEGREGGREGGSRKAGEGEEGRGMDRWTEGGHCPRPKAAIEMHLRYHSTRLRPPDRHALHSRCCVRWAAAGIDVLTQFGQGNAVRAV